MPEATHARATRPPVLAELAVIAFLLVVYDRITAVVGVKVPEAVERGLAILRVEHDLHVAPEAMLDSALAAHRTVSQAASLYYDLAHGTVTIGILAACYLWWPAVYRRARRAIVGVNLVALAVFWICPVAPPRLLGLGFTDIVARSGTWASWESDPSLSTHTNAYAATPSLHVAWATWVVLVVFAATRRRLARGIAVAHALLTTLIVVATGNHYIVDVVAGGLLSAGLWAVAAWAPKVVASRCLRTARPARER